MTYSYQDHFYNLFYRTRSIRILKMSSERTLKKNVPEVSMNFLGLGRGGTVYMVLGFGVVLVALKYHSLYLIK